MSMIVLQNANVFDGANAELLAGASVVIDDERIREVTAGPVKLPNARVIDAGGRTLMPGLIDAHAHPHISSLNVGDATQFHPTYFAHHAARVLRFALSCGFTSIRDTGGGDVGLAMALNEGLIEGPRLFYAGRVLSQTGGHADMRDHRHAEHDLCACRVHADSLGVIVDGVDKVRWAVREEIRKGAHHIKIMGSGGVSSPTDPVDVCQFAMEEIRVVVEEAERAKKYVAAHCHPIAAIRRCVEAGVRSIEHATFIDLPTAKFLTERGAYAVPTMTIMFALKAEGAKLGFPKRSLEKLEETLVVGLQCLENLHKAGAPMGFGCDLIGPLYTWQCHEFRVRAEVLKPIDILRSATSVNAEIMQRQGEIGCIAPGAYADLIVVNGNPLADIGLLAENGRHLPLIMKGGQIFKNEL